MSHMLRCGSERGVHLPHQLGARIVGIDGFEHRRWAKEPEGTRERERHVDCLVGGAALQAEV